MVTKSVGHFKTATSHVNIHILLKNNVSENMARESFQKKNQRTLIFFFLIAFPSEKIKSTFSEKKCNLLY